MEQLNYGSLLDFDETSKFLSAIQNTVPALEEVPEWDEFNLALGNADVAPLYSPSFEVSAEDTKQNLSLFPADQYSSTRLTSYTESIDSNFVASLEQSPNTTFLSPHALPDGLMNKEAPLFEYSHADYQLPSFTQSSSNGLVKKETADSVQYDETAESDVSTKKDSPSSHAKRTHDDDDSEEETKTEKKVRTSHRVIERNYRCNINSKINELRDVVPTLKIVTGKTGMLIADLEGLVPASKLNKASVLSKAIEYIDHLQRKNDSLQDKIARLQALVSEASTQGPSLQGLKMEPSTSVRSQFDFNFNLGDNNFALMYANDAVAPENAAQAYPMGFSQSRNSNMMLGGIAIAMGSSFITDDNFRGLGAIPMSGLFSNSPMVASHLISVLRLVVMASGLIMMLEPLRQMFYSQKDKKSTSQQSLWLTWLLVSCGLQLPPAISSIEKEAICQRLLGRTKTDSTQLLKDYALLSSSEITFENCLLSVLVGTLLIRKNPSVSTFMSLGLKRRGSLLVNLEYNGSNKNLKSLSTFIKTVDGLALFESENLLQRFINLSLQIPICTNVKSAENEMTYVDFYLRSRHDVFGVLYSWRILELIYELNIVFLELLVSQNDGKTDAMKSLSEDIEKLQKLISDNGALTRHLLLLKGVISSENVPSLISQIQDDIRGYLSKLDAIYNEPEITDDESDIEETSKTTIANESTNSLAADIVANLSIIYSLNIVDEETIVALVSSAISYFLNREHNLKLLQLLRLLKFEKTDQSVSLFSLTCFVKLLCVLVKSENEDKAEDSDEDKKSLWASMDSESCSVLESLVKIMRTWLNDNNKKDCLSLELRSDLSDLVVHKGLTLNGI